MTDWQSKNGYYPLSKGKIATLVFYFEIFAPFPDVKKGVPVGMNISKMDRTDVRSYRDIFKKIGGPWLWISRLKSDDDELRTILSHPDIETYRVFDGNEDVALLELDFKQFGSMEIRYLGILNEYMGKGIGAALINFSFRRALSKNLSHVWLHTCHFDGPTAVSFYEHFGFRSTRAAIEVMDDPRLSGDLPPDLAPHIPLLK